MTFETVVLSDATLDSSLEFVYKHLDRDEYPDLIRTVQTIGGRLTDLEMFVQKVKSGMTPDGKNKKKKKGAKGSFGPVSEPRKFIDHLLFFCILDAMNDILTRAVVEVRKSAFDFDSKDDKVLNWSTLQFWTILKKLASCETVSQTKKKIVIFEFESCLLIGGDIH